MNSANRSAPTYLDRRPKTSKSGKKAIIPAVISVFACLISIFFGTLSWWQINSKDDYERKVAQADARSVAIVRLNEFTYVDHEITQKLLFFQTALLKPTFREALATQQMHFAMDDEYEPKFAITMEEIYTIGRAYPNLEADIVQCQNLAQSANELRSEARDMLNAGPTPDDPNFTQAQTLLSGEFSTYEGIISTCDKAADELEAIAYPDNKSKLPRMSETFAPLFAQFKKKELKLAEAPGAPSH
jgi:hypothetical protein